MLGKKHVATGEKENAENYEHGEATPLEQRNKLKGLVGRFMKVRKKK